MSWRRWARSSMRALTASKVSTGGGAYGEKVPSRCATPSATVPSASTPKKPVCLRTRRSQSLPPLGCRSLTQVTVQVTATLSGQPRSRRRARPRVCTTAVKDVAVVRSTRPVRQAASQPSPSRPRVPTRTWVSPCMRCSVTVRTQVREDQGPSRQYTGPSGRSSSSGTIASCWASVASWAPTRERNDTSACWLPATLRPVTRMGRRSAVTGSSSRASSAAIAEPDCWSSTPTRAAGTIALARSWSQRTSIRSRSPRARCSAVTMSTVASALAALRASTRSVVERPRRTPWRVHW